MAEKVELELKLKGGDKAVKTLGKLEQELNDAREAIKKVEVGSKAFEKLATQIQKASSEVKTLEKKMEGLEPQQKAEAFLKMGEGIAGGFAVGQGAMALMGVESEELEKIQVKVQSAIAIAMGIRMMSEAALMFTTAKRVVVEKFALLQSKIGIVVSKAQAIGLGLWATAQGILSGAIGASSIALGVLKVAIMATGIGALVIGVVALVGAMSSWFSGSEDTSESQEELAANAKAVADAVRDQLTANRELADYNRAYAKEEDERKKKLLELNEALKQQIEETDKYNNVVVLYTENQETLNNLLNETSDVYDVTINQYKDLQKAGELLEQQIQDQIDAQNALIISQDATAASTKKLSDKEKADADRRREERKKQREEEAKELLSLDEELFLMRIEDDNEREKAKIEQDRQKDLLEVKRAGNKAEQILLIKEKYDILEAERQQKVDDAAFEVFIANNDKWNEERIANAEKQAEIDQTAADDKIALDQAVFDARRDMQTNAFSAGAALFEKNKKISKAIAVSQTIFSTQQAIVDALAAKGTDALLPYPIRLGNAISAGVIGAASVRNILTESMGSIDTPDTPDTMTPSTTGAFTLGGALPDQEPVKAYVVTDEMSDSQSLLSDIRRRSTI